MLVLSRQWDEQVVITVPASTTPTVIVQTIVDIRGDKVRLGFSAPKDTTIHRYEVAQDIEREQRAAAAAAPATAVAVPNGRRRKGGSKC